MSNKITVRVELKDKRIISMFEELRDHMKDKTNNRKEGKANTLRMAIRKAYDRMNNDKRILDNLRASMNRHIHGDGNG